MLLLFFSKRKWKYFYTFHIFIVKSLQKEQNSTNLLLWPQICRNKSAITPKWFNSLDTNSKDSSCILHNKAKTFMKLHLMKVQQPETIVMLNFWKIKIKYLCNFQIYLGEFFILKLQIGDDFQGRHHRRFFASKTAKAKLL